MKHYPQEHRVKYQVEWKKAVNRFEREFLNNFSTLDGDINWEKLVEFNSGKQKRKLKKSKYATEASPNSPA